MDDQEENQVDHANIVAAVKIPLLQSLVSGLLVLAFAVPAGYLLDLNRPWAVGCLAAAAASGLFWFGSVATWRGSVYCLRANEPDQHQDQEVVRVELLDDNKMTYAHLPANIDQLKTLAAGVLSGATLSEITWTGAGRPFSRAQFAELRAELVRRGLAVWNNPSTPARGIALTRGGLAAMRTFASMGPTSSPTTTRY